MLAHERQEALRRSLQQESMSEYDKSLCQDTRKLSPGGPIGNPGPPGVELRLRILAPDPVEAETILRSKRHPAKGRVKRELHRCDRLGARIDPTAFGENRLLEGQSSPAVARGVRNARWAGKSARTR